MVERRTQWESLTGRPLIGQGFELSREVGIIGGGERVNSGEKADEGGRKKRSELGV